MQDTRKGITAKNNLSFRYWLKGGVESRVCVQRQGEREKNEPYTQIRLNLEIQRSRTPCALKPDIALQNKFFKALSFNMWKKVGNQKENRAGIS